MSNLLSKLWPILLAIYIISPFDAHPLFLDDLIASGALFYLIYKNSRKGRYSQHQTAYDQTGHEQRSTYQSSSDLTLEDAYRTLGVQSNATLGEISKAYKEKMILSHPDKVSHLSEEIQEKAKELTLKLNDAYEFIKQNRK